MMLQTAVLSLYVTTQQHVPTILQTIESKNFKSHCERLTFRLLSYNIIVYMSNSEEKNIQYFLIFTGCSQFVMQTMGLI